MSQTATASTPPFGRMQPRVAWDAVKKLVNNPEETEHVFVIIRAMSGPSLVKGLARFRQTGTGMRLLQERNWLLETLLDRGQLSTLPQNTLGHHYLEFTQREQISADGLVAASESENDQPVNEDLGFYAARLRDMHDLWHTVTGFGRDELGEVCLLAFTYAQTQNRGIGLIGLVGTFKQTQARGWRVLPTVFNAYRRGRNAKAWLPAQDWEWLLTQPIDEVRANLGLTEPEAYKALQMETQLAA